MKINIFKKVSIVCIIIFFISSGFVSGYKTYNNNDYLSNSIDNNQEYIIVKNRYDYKNIFSNNYPVMENPIPILESGGDYDRFTVELVNTPAEFSWREVDGKDWTTRTKNQGNCGSCWLFAAMGAFESVIKIREDCSELDPDLSEQYVLSCLPNAGSCNGGNVEKCVYYYIKNTSAVGNYNNGVITEDCFLYQSDFNFIPHCSDKPQDWEEYLIPILEYEESWTYSYDPELRDTIKSLVFQKGPIMAYFWASDRFINWGAINKDPSDYYPDYSEDCPNFVNHGMTIVGWKDDPSIKNGGYWICKNTWGPNWGYKGFFNIEYDCMNVGGFIAWVDYDPDSYDWPPVADAGDFYYGETDQEIVLDGSRSIDSDGEIISYQWDFGDGSTGSGMVVSHVYSEKSVYPASLTVIDSIGQESTHITLVGIDEEPFIVEISGGIGIEIIFNNPVDVEMLDWEYDIDISGLVIPNRVSGIHESILGNGRIATTISLIGIGFGSINILIENYSKTTKYFSFGPIIILFD
jgi:hypothetical protein